MNNTSRIKEILKTNLPNNTEWTDKALDSIANELVKNLPIHYEPDEEIKTVIEKMSDELVQMREQLVKLEKLGFTMELMEIYIYKKTSVNLTEIRKVLRSQKEFLKETFKPVK